MGFCLGNLTVQDFLKRTGYKMSQHDIDWLEAHRQNNADVRYNSEGFHIFDLPFCVYIPEHLFDDVYKILKKYEDETPAQESCALCRVEITEKDKQEEARKVEENKRKQEWESTKLNPNQPWLVKYHMLVPVKVKDTYNNYIELFYWCFINTHIKCKYADIPKMPKGKAYVYINEKGLHGKFTLSNADEVDSNNYDPESNYVYGIGFYSKNGSYLGHCDDLTFEQVDFDIEECVNRFDEIDKTKNHIEIHRD